MVRSLCILAALSACTLASAAIQIPVLPGGDGTFYDVTGSSYDSFSATDPSLSAHYSFYGTSDTYAGNTSYLQFSLAGLSGILPDHILSATLNVNLEGRYLTAPTPTCGSIMHRANSSAANGSATQRLAGDQLVQTILTTTPLGWNSFDVTSYLKSDLTSGWAWSAFSLERDGTGDYSNRNAGFNVSSGDSAAAPYLSVVVPEPSAIGLIALGALALTRRR